MKKIYLLLMLGVLLGSGLTFTSCKEDEIKGTIIPEATVDNSPLGVWFKENYTQQYGIEVLYKWDQYQTDFDYYLVPISLEKAELIGKLVKHMWLDAYDEATGSPDFVRTNAPKQLLFIGSPAMNPESGSETLGTAEGGIKVVLYKLNAQSIDNMAQLNTYVFNTIHHEFGHILHQTQPYNQQEFNVISESYTGGGWVNLSSATAWQRGFVSPYGSNQPDDDFVEVISHYLVETDLWWNNMLDVAGVDGAAKINEKLAIVTSWYYDKWHIELDELRSIIRRRTSEVPSL